jgi:hypothetical protein
MPDERQAVDALIERLVRDADLPDARARAELRRELRGHFDEAGDSPEALRVALERFGSADAVARGFRGAYRRGRAALYVAKVVTSIVAASIAGLALELIANLRIGGDGAGLRLGGGYLVSAGFALTIVLVLVAAWELDIEPLCARLERRPARLLATFGALLGAIYFGHPAIHGPMGIHGPMDVRLMVVGSSVGVAVWACTVAIAARLDLAFASLLGPREE